jgi:hypothetical protein
VFQQGKIHLQLPGAQTVTISYYSRKRTPIRELNLFPFSCDRKWRGNGQNPDWLGPVMWTFLHPITYRVPYRTECIYRSRRSGCIWTMCRVALSVNIRYSTKYVASVFKDEDLISLKFFFLGT